MSWTEAIATTISAVAVPYGYTLAIWAAGMLAVSRYGFPTVREICFFVGGATLGYLVLDAFALHYLTSAPVLPTQIPSLAAVNVLAILPALAAAFLARKVSRKPLGFPVVGFVASLFYILALTFLVWMAGNVPLIAG